VAERETAFRTTVISVRGRKLADLLADPGFVYVGRRCAGWPASIWGNPFKPGDFARDSIRRACKSLPGGWGRLWGLEPTRTVTMDRLEVEDCVALYREYVQLHPGLAAALATLRGKALGCWCCDWDGTGEPSKPCHAVVLARLADAAEGQIVRDGETEATR